MEQGSGPDLGIHEPRRQETGGGHPAPGDPLQLKKVGKKGGLVWTGLGKNVEGVFETARWGSPPVLF